MQNSPEYKPNILNSWKYNCQGKKKKMYRLWIFKLLTHITLSYNIHFIFYTYTLIVYRSAKHPVFDALKKEKEKLSKNVFITASFSIYGPMHILSRLSRVLRLIPCCSYYWPLPRHYDVNDCLSAIRSINWIQRNVIHYSLQPSRCWGFVSRIPLLC